MTQSVDGLISGLNTSQVISQLMQVESAPQTALKGRLADENNKIIAYQGVSARFLALQTAGDALKAPAGWQSLSVASSSSSVTAAATTASTTGTVTFDVSSVAASHSLRTDEVTGTTAVIANAAAGIDITFGAGTPTHVALGTDGTLSGVVKAINATPTLGVTAAAVQTGANTYRLQLTSTKSGASSAFTISGLNVANAVLTQGSDASITVGAGAGAYTVTSASNTFSNVLPGVTFTVSALQPGVTLTSTLNTGSIADKIQGLVDAANAALTEMDKQSAIVPGGVNGVLAGDFTLRELTDNVSSTVATALTGGVSAASIGVQLDRSGHLTFDRNKFTTAMTSNPTSTQALGTQLATRLSDLARTNTQTGGTLTSIVDSHNTSVKDLNAQISSWDIRLKTKQDALQRQFASLEVALGTLKNQSNWLAGQLGSLSNGN
jgi:flagellar hook-associated protein 2